MNKELMAKVNGMMNPYNIYAVGGCVRDYILNITPKDFDFTTNANPDEIQQKIKDSGRRAYLTGKRFGTLGCKIDGQMVEITTFRGETYSPNNRKPEVEYLKHIDDDLSRRDFSINSIAMKLKNGRLKIIDNHGGQEDLKNGIIRCVGNSKIRFKEDPLRILRCIRFATRFNFEIEEKTADRMQKMAYLLLTISKERWMQELDKILLDDNVHYGIDNLMRFNAFRYILPEIHLQKNYDQNSKYHGFSLWEHTKLVVGATPKDINLRWGALLHDIGKVYVKTENKNGYSNYINHELLGAEMVEKIARHLKWSNERREIVKDLVLNHLKENSPLREYDNMHKNKV